MSFQQPALHTKEGPLTGSQRQRGMYLNAGTQDVGIDPDWDMKEYKWKGNTKRKKMAPGQSSDQQQ